MSHICTFNGSNRTGPVEKPHGEVLELVVELGLLSMELYLLHSLAVLLLPRALRTSIVANLKFKLSYLKKI